MKPYPKNTGPRKLSIESMWELHRVLNTAHGEDLASILQHTHPLKIETAMELLYGKSSVVTNGKQLVWYLLQGLQRNHFSAFLKTIRKE